MMAEDGLDGLDGLDGSRQFRWLSRSNESTVVIMRSISGQRYGK